MSLIASVIAGYEFAGILQSGTGKTACGTANLCPASVVLEAVWQPRFGLAEDSRTTDYGCKGFNIHEVYVLWTFTCTSHDDWLGSGDF